MGQNISPSGTDVPGVLTRNDNMHVSLIITPFVEAKVNNNSNLNGLRDFVLYVLLLIMRY